MEGLTNVKIEIPNDLEIQPDTLVRLPDGSIVPLGDMHQFQEAFDRQIKLDKFNPSQLEKYLLANKKSLLESYNSQELGPHLLNFDGTLYFGASNPHKRAQVTP